MAKIIKYLGAYVMWVADLGLTLWLAYLGREALLDILALFYPQGNFAYVYAAKFADKAFAILLGISWLVFMIATEAYFRAGVSKGDLLKRSARVTGLVLLCIFIVDLILFWIQNGGNANWLRWLILAAELGIGIILVVSAKTRSISKFN